MGFRFSAHGADETGRAYALPPSGFAPAPDTEPHATVIDECQVAISTRRFEREILVIEEGAIVSGVEHVLCLTDDPGPHVNLNAGWGKRGAELLGARKVYVRSGSLIWRDVEVEQRPPGFYKLEDSTFGAAAEMAEGQWGRIDTFHLTAAKSVRLSRRLEPNEIPAALAHLVENFGVSWADVGRAFGGVPEAERVARGSYFDYLRGVILELEARPRMAAIGNIAKAGVLDDFAPADAKSAAADEALSDALRSTIDQQDVAGLEDFGNAFLRASGI